MPSAPLLSDATPEQLEAFVQIVVLTAYADGELSPPEESLLLEKLTQLTQNQVPENQLRELIVELPPLSRGSNNWRADRISTLKKHLPSDAMRQEAFALATQVAQSDNGIGFRESRMLLNIATELAIDPSFAQGVIAGITK